MPGIRSASASDVDAFTEVFLECWRVSYALSMPASLVEGMTPARARSLWQDALEGGDGTYLVAEASDGVLAGFIGYRMSDQTTGYVSSLYVSPRVQGGGFGRLLLTEAEADLRRRGARTARLWVFEQNEPSRRFYERAGWRLDGTRETLAEWGQPQVGMAKGL
jgi:ribosomal protein S18 acetylase RimI-like enzyme